MKIRPILELLIVLIVCSCSTQTSKDEQQTEKVTYPHLGSKSELLIDYGMNQGVIKTKTNMTMDSRDILMGHINDGIDTTQIGDNSNKSILVRGCDPEMGRRAIKLLPPVLGNPEMVSVTNDDDFIAELQRKKWSVIFFAPGACRYDSTKSPIPGSRLQTKGWGLVEYRKLVRKHQGEDINIVETTDERLIVPLLRKALSVIDKLELVNKIK